MPHSNWGIFCKEFPEEAKKITRLGIIMYQAGVKEACLLPEYKEIVVTFGQLNPNGKALVGVSTSPTAEEVLKIIFTLGTAMLINLEKP